MQQSLIELVCGSSVLLSLFAVLRVMNSASRHRSVFVPQDLFNRFLFPWPAVFLPCWGLCICLISGVYLDLYNNSWVFAVCWILAAACLACSIYAWRLACRIRSVIEDIEDRLGT